MHQAALWEWTFARGDWTASDAGGGYAIARPSRPTTSSKSKESLGPELEGHTYCHRSSSGARKLGGIGDEKTSCYSRCRNHVVPTSDAGKPKGTLLRSIKDGPRLSRADAERHTVSGLRLSARRLRRSAHERRILSRRNGSDRKATRTCLRRRRNRGLHPDRRLVERRLRTLRHMPMRCGRKNVPFTSAPSVCFLEHLRSDTRTTSRDYLALDILSGNAPVHAQVWNQGRRDRRGCGEK